MLRSLHAALKHPAMALLAKEPVAHTSLRQISTLHAVSRPCAQLCRIAISISQPYFLVPCRSSQSPRYIPKCLIRTPLHPHQRSRTSSTHAHTELPLCMLPTGAAARPAPMHTPHYPSASLPSAQPHVQPPCMHRIARNVTQILYTHSCTILRKLYTVTDTSLSQQSVPALCSRPHAPFLSLHNAPSAPPQTPLLTKHCSCVCGAVQASTPHARRTIWRTGSSRRCSEWTAMLSRSSRHGGKRKPRRRQTCSNRGQCVNAEACGSRFPQHRAPRSRHQLWPKFAYATRPNRPGAGPQGLIIESSRIPPMCIQLIQFVGDPSVMPRCGLRNLVCYA